MQYRVSRKEYAKRRPEWLARFLLALSPAVYHFQTSEADARNNLSVIKDKILALGLPGHKDRVKMDVSRNAVILNNGNGKNYIRFRVAKVTD